MVCRARRSLSLTNLPSLPAKDGHAFEDYCSPNTRPSKVYDEYVRDRFYTAYLGVRSSQTASEMGVVASPSPVVLTNFGRTHLADPYLRRHRITDSIGYLDPVYASVPPYSFPGRRFYHSGDGAHYETQLEDPFHKYRPWKAYVPPTVPLTWELRYATKAGRTLDTLSPVRWRDYRVWLRKGDHRSQVLWNCKFGDRSNYPPLNKSPWYWTPYHYYYSHAAY